jgi:ABC-type nitrate/sulfonate/bicarbonate transport system substrate-binding protein
MRAALKLSILASALLAIASTTQAEDHVRVGTPEGTAYIFAPIDVGNGAGIFGKHGLTVEKLNFAGGGKIGEAMSADAVDVTVSGNTDLAFIAKGEPAKAVAVAAGAPVEMAIIVRSDGSITKPSDLRGKTIGVTSPTSLTSWLALAFSRDNGWGSDGVKRAYIGSMTSEVAGLLTKNVDAIVGPVEGAYLLQAKGQGQVLMTFGDMKVFITHIIYAHDNFIKDHPDALRRFLAGWFDTIAYMKTHKAETLRLTEPVTKLPPETADKVYDLETPALTDHGRFDQKALTATMQSFLDVGVLDKLPDNPHALYTEEFLPK